MQIVCLALFRLNVTTMQSLFLWHLSCIFGCLQCRQIVSEQTMASPRSEADLIHLQAKAALLG